MFLINGYKDFVIILKNVIESLTTITRNIEFNERSKFVGNICNYREKLMMNIDICFIDKYIC